MQRGCESFKERRSDSSECPTRIVEGLMSVRSSVCTSASVVVTGSSAAAVMPEKLGSKISARNKDRSLANLPREIIGDWAWWFDKLIVDNFSRVKVDNANPS